MSKYEGLPAKVVETDHRLETAASAASDALVKHRWHWTLDESNPHRVSIRAYAAAIGRAETTVRHQVNGYVDWTASDSARTLSQSIERAKMGVEREAATEAIATARGVEFSTVRQSRPDEIRRVRQIAQERAEKHGTSVAEEAPKVAGFIVKAEKAEQARSQERKQKLGLRFVEMEGKLSSAKRVLTDALNIAHDVPWGDEERALLADTVANIKALLGLIDTALVGAADVDWDRELAKLAVD